MKKDNEKALKQISLGFLGCYIDWVINGENKYFVCNCT